MNLLYRHFLLPTCLVVLDAVTKIVAYWALPQGADISHEATLQFVLRVNPVGLGSYAHDVLANPHGYEVLIFDLVFSCLVGVSLFVAAWRRALRARTIVALIVLAVVGGYLGALASQRVPVISIETVGLTCRAMQTLMWAAIWFTVSSTFWRLGSALLLAAGLGNLLSYLYPPFGIVDFLWSAPIHGVVDFGVFNIADAMLLLSYPVFAWALVRSIALRLWARPTVQDRDTASGESVA
jgi:lipoprotein signal peptidase